mgnify:CR=1 FL=1
MAPGSELEQSGLVYIDISSNFVNLSRSENQGTSFRDWGEYVALHEKQARDWQEAMAGKKHINFYSHPSSTRSLLAHRNPVAMDEVLSPEKGMVALMAYEHKKLSRLGIREHAFLVIEQMNQCGQRELFLADLVKNANDDGILLTKRGVKIKHIHFA